MIRVLKQSDYQTFLKKVAILNKAKITMHTPVDAEKWDEVCG